MRARRETDNPKTGVKRCAEISTPTRRAGLESDFIEKRDAKKREVNDVKKRNKTQEGTIRSLSEKRYFHKRRGEKKRKSTPKILKKYNEMMLKVSSKEVAPRSCCVSRA